MLSTRTRSQRDHERDIRRTRTEGARRALRSRQSTGAKRTFPSSDRVDSFAARIRRPARARGHDGGP